MADLRSDSHAAINDERVDDLQRWSDDPSAVLALNARTAAFRCREVSGFIAYRRAGAWLLQIGGVYAAPQDRPVLIDAFRRHAAQQRCRVLAVQLQRRDAVEHAAAGFTVNQIGASYALRVPDFTLRGGHFVRLRNKISRAERAGVVIESSKFTDLAPNDVRALAELDRKWLRGKGRHARPLAFMVGELGGPADGLRRLLLARSAGRVVGYVSLSPVYGSRPGWLHDLSRRSTEAPPGVMELLVASCLQICRDDGVPWWHFGFTPFTALHPQHAFPGASPTIDWAARFLWSHGQRIYPAVTQLDYKQKWGDLTVLPDYIAFDDRPRLAGVLKLLQVANLI